MSKPYPKAPFEVALVGAGRVGTAVTRLLTARGHHVTGIWSRSPDSRLRAAGLLGGAPIHDLGDAVAGADVVLVGVTDHAISPLAARIAPHLSSGAVVCHFAGSLGIEPLGVVEAAGAVACALHPVQSCPDVATALERLPGSAWGVTCRAPLEAWSRALVAEELGGRPVSVAEEDRPLWHAAAVTTANGITALLAIGESMLAGLGAPGTEVLAPLAAGALANVRDRGAAAALTGPVVRAERGTLERHVEVLRMRSPQHLDPYLSASRVVLAGAQLAGRIDARTRVALEQALDEA